MARTVRECLWGPAAHCRLHMEVIQASGGTGQCMARRPCAAGLGDRVGVGLSRAGLRGVAQTPPSVVCGGRGRHAAGPSSRGGGGGEGVRVRGGLTRGRPGLSPSLPQPQACDPVWLQPWGWGGLSLMAQSWDGRAPRPLRSPRPTLVEEELKGRTLNLPAIGWGAYWNFILIYDLSFFFF